MNKAVILKNTAIAVALFLSYLAGWQIGELLFR